MKLLYVATDQAVPGSTGGSVHVEEVARGLARRGHAVHVVAAPRGEMEPLAAGELELHAARLLLPHRMFRWTAKGQMRRLIERLGVELVLERYYNFAGEGIRAAYQKGIPSVLEVNSPVVDHPRSLKARVDGALLFRPLRRLREEQCRKASAIVTPLPAILPPGVPRHKVHRIHWGANVDRFRPGLMPSGPASRLPIPEGARVVVFSGSFRRWHGADVLIRAAARVLAGPEAQKAFFLLLGSGPDRWRIVREVERLGIGTRVHMTGAVPHYEMPQYLARCHVGVAPYQPSRHGQLQLGFYWSPLKVFEYMASGLPVVTLDIDPLREIVRQNREGLLVGEQDEEALAAAIETLIASPSRAEALGRSARERVVSLYSWQVHCEKLEGLLRSLLGK